MVVKDSGIRLGVYRIPGWLATDRYARCRSKWWHGVHPEHPLQKRPSLGDTVTDALFECGTGEEFVERVGAG